MSLDQPTDSTHTLHLASWSIINCVTHHIYVCVFVRGAPWLIKSEQLASQIRDCNLISCTTRLLSQSDTCPCCFEVTLSQRLMSCWGATKTHVWVTSVSFCHCQFICDFHLSFLFFICPILIKYIILNKTHRIHTQLHSQADISGLMSKVLFDILQCFTLQHSSASCVFVQWQGSATDFLAHGPNCGELHSSQALI